MGENKQNDYLQLCVEHGLYLMIDKESQSVIILYETGKKEDETPIISRVSESFGDDAYGTTIDLIGRVIDEIERKTEK